jgi:predicted signal transduction protein with EAL and GGDEF domain
MTDPDAVAATVISHAAEALSRPFDVPAGGTVTIGASAGYSVFPRDGTDVAALLADADAKMYRAKHRRRAKRLDAGTELDRLVERAARARQVALAEHRTTVELLGVFDARRRARAPE